MPIFNTLDFHISTRCGEEPLKLSRQFRQLTNHVADSFSLRIPKRIRTGRFHKLNVTVASERGQRAPYCDLDGYGCVEIVNPRIASIYKTDRKSAIRRVKAALWKGIEIAAKHDAQFAEHLLLWRELLATVHRPFDFDMRIRRSHPSRRWAAEGVLRISPQSYYHDVVIRDSRSQHIIQRHTIQRTECLLPLFGRYCISKLRWQGDVVVVTRKNGHPPIKIATGLCS